MDAQDQRGINSSRSEICKEFCSFTATGCPFLNCVFLKNGNDYILKNINYFESFRPKRKEKLPPV